MVRVRALPVLAISVALAAGSLAPATAQGPGHGNDHGQNQQDRWVRQTLKAMTLEQKVGQLLVPYVTGATATTASAENTARFGVATPAEAVQKLHLGGVIYFAWSGNTTDPQQIATLSNGLQKAALTGVSASTQGKGHPKPDRGAVPLTIATDQETGLVARVGAPATQFPGAMALGAGRSLKNTRTTYAITGHELAAIGINTDYAPDADVNVNPANPVIGVRSFSSDPKLVARNVSSAIAGLQDDADISAVAKHFPGHGDTGSDSHTSLPVITHTREQWEKIDAPPFKAAIDAGIDSIMTAHISFPELEPNGDPSTLSKLVLTGMLRDELGFRGVIATDSLRMEGVRAMYSDSEIAIRAIEAGADVLLDPQEPLLQYNAVIDAVHSKRLTEKRIDQSVTRILAMKHKRGVINQPYVDTAQIDSVVGTKKHLAQAQKITDRTPTLISDDANLVPLPKGTTLVTGWGQTGIPFLADELTERGRAATPYYTGTTPTAAQVTEATRLAKEHDQVVVLTSAAWSSTAQQTLVKALQASGTPVLVVAVRDAYDIAYLGDTPSYLATYSSTPVALTSVAKLLDGSIRPKGKLPVDIPSATDPTAVLYPYGTGLTS